jgi:hypothetical protein
MEQFKRREMRVFWHTMKQTADDYRRMQFVQDKPPGYNKKAINVLKIVKKDVHAWSIPKKLLVKQGSPLPFLLKRDLLKKGWIIKTVNQALCPNSNLVAGDRVVTAIIPGQYPLLWTMSFHTCCQWINAQVCKSDITFEFNVVQEEGLKAAVKFSKARNRVSVETFEKMNAVARKGSPSHYLGVRQQTQHRGNMGRPIKYTASVHYGGKIHYLGKFDNAVDAARAHDVGSMRYHGSKAKLNFPTEDENPLSTGSVSGSPSPSEQPQADLIPFFKSVVKCHAHIDQKTMAEKHVAAMDKEEMEKQAAFVNKPAVGTLTDEGGRMEEGYTLEKKERKREKRQEKKKRKREKKPEKKQEKKERKREKKDRKREKKRQRTDSYDRRSRSYDRRSRFAVL